MVYFSPRGGCTAAIVEQIEKAKSSVKVQAYRLTSIPIVRAIADAHGRGVKVTIILDKMQQSIKYSDATYFYNKDIQVLIDPKHAIAHNKVMLIDDRVIITGSFNFSANAEDDNAENILIIEDKAELIAAYAKNFAEHESHAVPYRGVGGPGVDSSGLDAQTAADCRDWLKLADLYVTAKNFSAARETLNKVIVRGGESEYVQQAKKMLETLKEPDSCEREGDSCCEDVSGRTDIADRWLNGYIDFAWHF